MDMRIIIETVVWIIILGAALTPIMLAVILTMSAAWWARHWYHKITSTASPPSR